MGRRSKGYVTSLEDGQAIAIGPYVIHSDEGGGYSIWRRHKIILPKKR